MMLLRAQTWLVCVWVGLIAGVGAMYARRLFAVLERA